MTAPRTAQARYWAFYWPLALTGAVTVLGTQIQNGVLARMENAAAILAAYAVAQAVLSLFNAAQAFAPQLTTRFARGAKATARVRGFILGISAALAGLVALLATLGQPLIIASFSLSPALQAQTFAFLLALAPMVWLNGMRFYLVGRLIQQERTGRVTVLNGVHLTVLIVSLAAGLALRLDPVLTLVGAQALAGLVHATLAIGALRPGAEAAAGSEAESEELPSYQRLRAFFGPVVLTGIMFALSRPILYAAIGGTGDGILTIAALRIAFDFTFFFQQAANQFRHFFVTFGLDAMAEKRRFMIRVALGLTLAMALTAFTPLGPLLIAEGIGAEAEVTRRALAALQVMTLLPLLIILRNLFHGILMVEERTGGMALGSILRVLTIAGLAQLLAPVGLLTPTTAAWTLLAGFATETAVVAYRVLRLRALAP
ncbi:MAG: hypothetical protein VX179_01910 [Pseudomonadota bacterium]|nr:hypothetical protein [Pseudomonadota bacterium]